jgi:hypothetical protein
MSATTPVFEARFRLDDGTWTEWIPMSGHLNRAEAVADATLRIFRDLVGYEMRSTSAVEQTQRSTT